MQLSHTHPVRSVVFNDPNLVSSAGLVPMLALARSAGLTRLADQHLSVPTDKGANAGLKVSSLVAGMVAGADSIDDMALLRHGGMGKVFTNAYAPSSLGSFHRPGQRPGRKVLVRTDGAGGTKQLIEWLTSQRLSYSVGFTLPVNTPGPARQDPRECLDVGLRRARPGP